MRLHGLLYCSSHLLKGGQQEMEIEVRDVRKYNLVDHVNFVIPRNGLICYHPPQKKVESSPYHIILLWYTITNDHKQQQQISNKTTIATSK